MNVPVNKVLYQTFVYSFIVSVLLLL